MPESCRHLIVILGDQLNRDSAAFDRLDAAQDRVWMAEVADEAEKVWSHKVRIAVFLSAMRHFRDGLREDGLRVDYHALDDHRQPTLSAALAATLDRLKPQKIITVAAGEYALRQSLAATAAAAGVELEYREERHFYCSETDFQRWLDGRKRPRMEHFYRHLRRRENVLMEQGQPLGGRWNYDAKNRQSFGKKGPGPLPPAPGFAPDRVTRDVLSLVAQRFADHPGSLAHFDWPVTAGQARAALDDFIAYRLPSFGAYQDALWTGEPFLYHSLLSSALNLKLLDPRTVVDAAERAQRDAPDAVALSSAEGFIRQIIGWREYVRGLYWAYMPDYLHWNDLGAEQPLPAFYWDADTDMRCLRETITQTLDYGYAHHIQRLMVTGLFALLLGVEPKRVHAWYLAIYVDAVEWVELPNVLGMSQYADGGLMGSKPYAASGRYIQRMSNYCAGCRYDPGEALGDRACPFTTLYWDFLDRHYERFIEHPRAAMQWRNLDRLDPQRRAEIRDRARALRERLAGS